MAEESEPQREGETIQPSDQEREQFQARIAREFQRMAAKVGELERDPGVNESILRRELDAKIRAMDYKIDSLIESNDRLAQKLDDARAEFNSGRRSERRNRWGGVLTTVLGVGAMVAAIFIFAPHTTQFLPHAPITRIETAIAALTKQVAALSQTTPVDGSRATQPLPQQTP